MKPNRPIETALALGLVLTGVLVVPQRAFADPNHAPAFRQSEAASPALTLVAKQTAAEQRTPARYHTAPPLPEVVTSEPSSTDKQGAGESLASATVLASNRSQPDYIGRLGVGFHNSDTPVGMRMWLTPDFGFDVGLGFSVANLFNDDTPNWGASVEGGLLFALAHLENMIVLFRGGLQLDFDDNGISGDVLAFDLEGLLGIEYFLTALGLPNLSLSAGVSGTVQVSYREDLNEVDVALFTGQRALSVVSQANLGFHFYF